MPICKDCLGYRFCSMRDNENFTEKERLCFTNKNRFVEVVRCKDCKHCKELAPHCEINRYAYFHCNLWRGEETTNVWHKYKKYTADYSIVEPTDFCSYGELKESEGK